MSQPTQTMGQYFKLVNPDRNEFVSLPGLLKAIERLSNHKAMAMIGYLILKGPQDGTVFRTSDIDPDEWDYELNEKLAKEGKVIGQEKERWEKDPEKAARTAAISYSSRREIAEANQYAGRWAGDRVMLVGDYDDSGLYSDPAPNYTVKIDGEKLTVNHARGPVVESSIDDPSNVHKTMDRDLEPGDTVSVRERYLPDKFTERSGVTVHEGRGMPRVYGEFVSIDHGEWTDITDGLESEMDDILGEDIFDDSGTVMRPDMVIG